MDLDRAFSQADWSRMIYATLLDRLNDPARLTDPDYQRGKALLARLTQLRANQPPTRSGVPIYEHLSEEEIWAELEARLRRRSRDQWKRDMFRPDSQPRVGGA